MPLNFTAIDFETANYSSASPCAVGLVKVVDGKIVDSWATLMEPPGEHNWFQAGNIGIHGIRPSDVTGGPTAAEVFPLMFEWIDGDVLIAHNAPFDMGVIRETSRYLELPLPQLEYACSLSISRKTYNLESYRLNSVAYAVGFEDFKHHDALADAEACARIIMHAAKRKDADDLAGLLEATKQVLKPLAKD